METMTTEMELPEGWQLVKLSNEQLFAFESGLWTGKKAPFLECAVVRNTNFQNDGHLNFSDVAMIQIEARQLERKRLKAGDIIIERSGGGPNQPVGRVVLFELPDGDFSFSNFTARLRVIDEQVVDFQFLNYYLLHFHYSGHTELLQRRTTGIRNLDFTEYKNSDIPLPPLPEQRTIATVLGAVQAALATRRREQQLEQEQKAALLEQLFTRGTLGEATRETEIGELPMNWGVVKLEALIIDGPQNGLYKHASFYGEGTPIIRINDFDLGGRFVTTEFNRTRLEQEDIDRYAVRKNDLLINRVNSLSHIGKCARVIELPEPTVFESNMMRFAVDEQKLSPEFLSYFLTLDSTRAYIRGIAKRAVAQSSINQSDLKGIVLPLPPLPEQQRIVAVLGALDAKLGALAVEVARLEELFRALLEELLSGRLRVATDANRTE